MKGVWRRHDPADALPLVFDSPHSGETYPDDFVHLPPRALVRQAEDTHVARLWSHVIEAGATLIEAEFPRAYVDPNRSRADIDLALLADAWDEPMAPTRKTEQGMGLVWRLARGGAPLYAHKLTAAEVHARIAQYYAPYHAELEAVLTGAHRMFGAVWHVDCHSMPAIGDAFADDPGRERSDFVLGDRDGTTCDRQFTAFVKNAIAALGYSVAVNDPYKGVEIVRRYGRPAERRHSLQIEIKRTLYMDESTLVPNAGYARLEADLRRLAHALADYVRGQLGRRTGLAT
jgi:N-formylglutamate deformylase